MAFDSTYRPEEVERIWRERWEAARAFHAPEPRRAEHFSDRHPAAERHRRPAHRPRAQQHAPGHPRALAADAGPQRPLGAGDRSRGDRHPERGGEATGGAGDRPARDRPRGVRAPGLALEGGVGRQDPQPAAAPRLLLRLGAAALHPRRGALARRAPGVRLPPRRGADLPRRAHHQLVPALSHGALRPRGREREHPRPPLPHPLPVRRRARAASSSRRRGPRRSPGTPRSPSTPRTRASGMFIGRMLGCRWTRRG